MDFRLMHCRPVEDDEIFEGSTFYLNSRDTSKPVPSTEEAFGRVDRNPDTKWETLKSVTFLDGKKVFLELKGLFEEPPGAMPLTYYAVNTKCYEQLRELQKITSAEIKLEAFLLHIAQTIKPAFINMNTMTVNQY